MRTAFTSPIEAAVYYRIVTVQFGVDDISPCGRVLPKRNSGPLLYNASCEGDALRDTVKIWTSFDFPGLASR